ncbi:MAG: aspartate aminotransferase family protein [Anaerolineae bacterium]
MINTDTARYEQFLVELKKEYELRFPKSKEAQERAQKWLVDGVSHGARQYAPYAFRVTSASGARAHDIDGHDIVDFWQGHYANILGHNPAIICQALIEDLEAGYGLHTGLIEEREAEYAATLATAIGAEQVRLTTAGTLATMYAIMLARAHTGRKLVLKVSGGWHGANPLALKGVGRNSHGYDHVDSAGVPNSTGDEVLVTPFNDVENLRKLFRSVGDRIACFIFEPRLGAAGFAPATSAFMSAARELTAHYGALLILDEVITGFRFCASGMQRLYGVKPDLTTFGKVIGGGMPISAVAGRTEVMNLVSDKPSVKRVMFNGGTFSSHPLSLLAGQKMLNYLIENENVVYPRLQSLAEELYSGVEKVFAQRGILARCMGRGNDLLRTGSLGAIYFPQQADFVPQNAEDFSDPELCGALVREQALKLGLLLGDVNIVHGLGAISTAHGDAEFNQVYAACDAFAIRLKAAGLI